MRTNTINVARTTAVAVGAILATGCGTGVGPADPAATTAPALSSSSASVPFDQKAVRRDLQAAVAAAGLAGGKVEAGLGAPREPRALTDTEKGRKAAALDTRLTPCVVSWSSTGNRHRSPSAANPADTRRRLKIMLSGLTARGWKEIRPPQEEPLEGNGTYYMASYKKKGWFLHARHAAAPVLDLTTVMATEEACFGRLTAEEQALLEN
ncbi:hypothetical protein OG788_46500 [Streptomyces sp. NBC_00647]|uniref:hypothetical protein n=1 Tax=Streptomyces sp. NBC_00647 TaxID=2975796 RepID=UPI0032495FD9